MAKNKTTTTDANVEEFINSFAATDQKKKDSFELLKIMQETSGFDQKCMDRVSLGSEIIITNTTADTKVMLLLLVFHPEKLPFHFMSIPDIWDSQNKTKCLKNSGNSKWEKRVFM